MTSNEPASHVHTPQRAGQDDTCHGGRELGVQTFQAIAEIAKLEAGLDLPLGKRRMVAGRLLKRLVRLDLPSYEAYLDRLESGDPEELRRLISALTTNVSAFFREAAHFDYLQRKVFPELLHEARGGGRIRLWSAGCAQGQEAFSLAMALVEVAPDAPRYDIRILATDIDRSVLRSAEFGTYHASMLKGLSAERTEAYLVPDHAREVFQVRQDLRDMVIFRPLNLHEAWPMPGRFDVILCRNVVIYFGPAEREALWPRFQDKLNPGGCLCVGHSEKVIPAAAPLLEPDGHTIYRRLA